MLDVIQSLNYKEKLLRGNFGIERETLRVNEDGKLALTKHPEVFECKITHPYITTDFSESQIELITPTLHTLEEVYSFLNSIYDITALELKDEYYKNVNHPSDYSSRDICYTCLFWYLFVDSTKQGIDATHGIRCYLHQY